MNKIYTIFVSSIDNNIKVDVFSVKNIKEKENQLRNVLLSKLIKPPDAIIEKIIEKIKAIEN